MTNPISASCYFLVIEPLHFPIRAEPGEYLSVWPLQQNLWVFDRSGDWVVRRGSFEEGKLWSELQRLMEERMIRQLFDEDALKLRRPSPNPLPVADVPSRPALRVIRAG